MYNISAMELSKKTPLSRHPAVEKLKSAGKELGLPKAGLRLRLGLAALMGVMHGRGEVDVSGEDNLIEAAKRAKEEGRGLVIVSSHESGLDVPTASYLASLIGKTAIGIASTNSDWIKKDVGGFNAETIQYVLTGIKNFIRVPYKWITRKRKRPDHFSIDDYEEAVERAKNGEIVVMAGFSDHESVKDREIGSAAVHIAAAAGVELVPVSVLSDNAEAFSSGPSAAVLKGHKTTIKIGDTGDDWVAVIRHSYEKASPEAKKNIREMLKKDLSQNGAFKEIISKGARR